MNDLGVIDRFMETFIRYIDSGFGLLSGDVAFLTTILIGIDITLAGLALGARRRAQHSRPAYPQGALCRRLRLHLE